MVFPLLMKIIGLISIFTLLTACSNFAQNANNLSVDFKYQPILETVKNLETLPDTSLGNQAVLIKEDYGFCQIEFTGFYQAGKVVENWAFNKNKLLSASTTQMRYTSNISDLEQTTKIASVHSTPFNIQLTETLQNFEKLKKNFSDHALNRCIN